MTAELERQLLADLDASAECGEGLRAWWDQHHTAGHSWWLSGTSPEYVWNLLGITHLLLPGASVLEIGVGTGESPRSLAARGCLVSVLDISPVAIGKVAEFARGYLAEDLSSLSAAGFDIAFSHLVAQHMSDVDLAAQIAAVMRSLKPGGVFAIQFPSYVDSAQAFDETLRSAKGGGVCRSPEKMEGLAAAAGAKSFLVKRDVPVNDQVCISVIHLTREDEQ